MLPFLPKKSAKSTPITPVTGTTLKDWLKKQPRKVRAWVEQSGFTGAVGSFLLIPDESRVLFGVKEEHSLYAFADLPSKLPVRKGGYYIDRRMDRHQATHVALGWALGCYHFGSYKSGKKKEFSPLTLPPEADKAAVQATAGAVYLVRDLVNTPANDLGPEELAEAAKKVARTGKASIKIIVGEDLLKKNYPAIYDVGKGSPRKPRFIDIRWGSKKNPLVTLIGKGVCFDTGGLDIKPGNAMALMKKDMGGAAHVLGLAQMVMAEKLPVRLRVLIPAVENSTGGNSYRPGDILKTRKGISVEVGDTDAEGRIILADALAEACTERPELIIDFATLTGAARVALGPDLPALFSNDEKIAAALLETATETEDPLWRLPLWQPYKEMLNSKIADTNNVGGAGHAGAITAALFLEKFIDKGIPWVHLDTFAWNGSSKPGRPEGGEALGMRACHALLKKKFGKRK